jgi:hypothetical protein
MVDNLYVEWVRKHREYLESLRSDGFLSPNTIKDIDKALQELE